MTRHRSPFGSKMSLESSVRVAFGFEVLTFSNKTCLKIILSHKIVFDCSTRDSMGDLSIVYVARKGLSGRKNYRDLFLM